MTTECLFSQNTCLGVSDFRRLTKSLRNVASLSWIFDLLLHEKSRRAQMQRFPVRPYSCDSANCIRPLNFWASTWLICPCSNTLLISVDISWTLASVLYTAHTPEQDARKLKTTPSASQSKPKGTHFLPSSAKAHPSNLNREDAASSELLANSSWLSTI